MAGSSKRSSLRDIADATGYGRTAVSLALRNHPSLPLATREIIRKAADELGYRPNPLVTALMTQVRGKLSRHHERIAMITRQSQPIGPQTAVYYRLLHQAIVDAAACHDIDIDQFHHDPERSDARLSQILRARGIHGVLFFPGRDREDIEYPVLEWEHFTTVLIGFRTAHEAFHQVTADHGYNIDHVLEHARMAGCRRIGLVVPVITEASTNHTWSSHFLRYQHDIRARDRVPLFPSPRYNFDDALLLKWFRAHRPDVILTPVYQLKDKLEAAGVRVPEDVRMINLAQREEPGLAGVNPNTTEVGRAAVDLLVSLMQTNQRGLPEFPRTIAIKGRWAPGPSFPETNKPGE